MVRESFAFPGVRGDERDTVALYQFSHETVMPAGSGAVRVVVILMKQRNVHGSRNNGLRFRPVFTKTAKTESESNSKLSEETEVMTHSLAP